MKIGRRKEVPVENREYSETYKLGYRLDYLLGIILAFTVFIYAIYKLEIKGFLKDIIYGNRRGFSRKE